MNEKTIKTLEISIHFTDANDLHRALVKVADMASDGVETSEFESRTCKVRHELRYAFPRSKFRVEKIDGKACMIFPSSI